MNSSWLPMEFLVNLMTIDAAIIDLLKACKVISRFGVGSDNIDLSACASAGIHVTVVPDYCTDEVSDHCSSAPPDNCA